MFEIPVEDYMDIKDILGLGKVLPLDKFLEVIEKGLGRITKSHFERKDIDTEAYRIRRLAEANSDALKTVSNAIQDTALQSDIEYKENSIALSTTNEMRILPLAQRGRDRINYQLAKSQQNIENVLTFAAEELIAEQTVSSERVNEDWITKFFNIAEDISNQEMQQLWGKILAGEIKQPNSFSMRTLEIVKNITKIEADVFTNVANYAIIEENKNHNFLFVQSFANDLDYRLLFEHINLLKEINLLQPVSLVEHVLSPDIDSSSTKYLLGEKILIVDQTENCSSVGFDIELFTTSGNELLALHKIRPPMKYIRNFAQRFNGTKWKVSIADITHCEDNRVEFENLRPFNYLDFAND